MTKKPNYKLRILFFPILFGIFALVCTFLAISAFGYTFRYENGQIVSTRKGIILLATRPGDAKVILDGKKYKSNSPIFYLFPMRISWLDLGEHTVRIEKEGYETWEGTFNVEPGMVSWANYILLVSSNRTKSPYNLSGSMTQTYLSPDKQDLLVSSFNPGTSTYTIMGIITNTKESRRIYEVKLKEGTSLAISGYSTSKNRILLDVAEGEKKTHRIIEAKENGSIWEVDSLFALQFDGLVFNPRNENELYALKAQNLYLVNYQNKNLSAILAENVKQIVVDEGSLYFVQDVEGNLGLWRLEQNNTKTNIVKELPTSDNYLIDYLPETDSFAILSQKDKDLYYYVVENGTPILKKISGETDWFLASPKSKYLLVKKGSALLTYDIEKNIFYTVISDKDVISAAWFSDESNLIYSSLGKVSFITFNGYYNKELFDNDVKYPVFTATSNNDYYFAGLNSDKNIVDLFSSSI